MINPGARVVNARVQLRQQLDQATHHRGSRFVPLLSAFGERLQHVGVTHVRDVQYEVSTGRMQVSLQVPDTQVLENLLSASGDLTVTLKSSTVQAGAILVSLTVMER